MRTTPKVLSRDETPGRDVRGFPGVGGGDASEVLSDIEGAARWEGGKQ